MTTMSYRRRLPLLLVLVLLITSALVSAPPARAEACPTNEALIVPGAEMQKITCVEDLSVSALLPLGLTVATDWFGLNATGTVNPTAGPGIQIDGYFPDTPPPAPYAPNSFNGWNHDAQFVIRLPEHWNGKLVIAPSPGNRRQYSSDFIISDYVLAKGYAYASTDKGNVGASFYLDGERPGDAIAEWHRRVGELTRAVREVIHCHYGRYPERTYLFGISNGGYQVRYALERDARLYDGGVDWEGTLFTRNGPNLFTYLPTALTQFPIYANPASTPEQVEAARQAMLAAGFAPGSEFLWPVHNQVYWALTQRIYRLEFDPDYTGLDAEYDYASRPAEVKDAVGRVSLTGRIRRPLITVHGTLDSLLPPATNADPYVELIPPGRRERLHRYYLVENGNHVDGFLRGFEIAGLPIFPDDLEPLLPCARAAFEALEQWVEGHVRPPASGLITRDKVDLNSCQLP